jgi:hypothetical protein
MFLISEPPHSFIFTLQEFARELVSLIDAMGRIYFIEQERAHRDSFRQRAIGRISKIYDTILKPSNNPSAEKAERSGLKRRFCTCGYSLFRTRRVTHPSLDSQLHILFLTQVERMLHSPKCSLMPQIPFKHLPA